MEQIYYTIYNGHRIFKVVIKDNTIMVFDDEEIIKKKQKFINLLHSINNYEHLFIPDGGPTYPQYKGNSLLVKHDKTHYTHIGDVIFKFETIDEIVDYQSHMIRSFCTEPFAIGTENTYILKYCSRYILNNLLETNNKNPYVHVFDETKFKTFGKYTYTFIYGREFDEEKLMVFVQADPNIGINSITTDRIDENVIPVKKTLLASKKIQ